MPIPGKSVVTWKKLDGTWKVTAHIFNTDMGTIPTGRR